MMSDLVYDKILTGDRIRERRSALHLTQEKFAEKIGMSTRTVTDLERGVVGLSIETLFALCSGLNCTPNDLLLPEAEFPATELDWLVQTLSVLPEHERHTAIDIARSYLRSL